jgi:hypothetical protein
MAGQFIRSIVGVAASTAVLLFSGAAVAEGLDGEGPILCATDLVFECGPEGQCLTGGPEAFDVPKIIQLDVMKKEAVTIRLTGEQRTVAVASTQITDTAIMLQGFQPEFSWSATIERSTGQLSLTAASTGVGFSMFGTCGVL